MVKIHGTLPLPISQVDQIDFDAIWAQSKDLLGRIARMQRQFSVSPRPNMPFHVGAGLVVLTPKCELMHIGTSNFKQAVGPRQHLCPDCCAEVYGIATARKTKGRIIGMVVEAPPQADDQSKVDFGVTVSCWYCRYEYRLELDKEDSPLMPETRLRFNHPEDPDMFLEESVKAFLARFPNDPVSLGSEHLYHNQGGP